MKNGPEMTTHPRGIYGGGIELCYAPIEREYRGLREYKGSLHEIDMMELTWWRKVEDSDNEQSDDLTKHTHTYMAMSILFCTKNVLYHGKVLK